MARKLEIEVSATGTDVATRKLGEVDTAIGGVQSSAQTANRDMVALGQSWQKAGQGMRSLGTGLTVGVTLPIAGAAAGFARLGINAVESEDLFARSFGDMADSARAWSEDLNARLGLNAFALREQAGLLNMMFKSMGLGEQTAFDLSTSLNQLAIDMGSAFNLSTAEAMDKIRSGMTGQTEPLQRLGILLHQSILDEFAWRTGIAETGVALTEQQKVLARYGSLMEQTSQIQGNFAATADQPANSMKAMRETFTQVATEIGIALIPVISDLIGILQAAVPYIKSAAEWFSNASPTVQRLTVGATALAAALGPVLVVVGSLVSAIGVLMPVISTAGATIGAIATGPIGWVVAAIAGLTAAWLAWGDDITAVVSSTYATVKEYLWDKFEPVLTPIIGLLGAVMDMFTAFGNLVGAVVVKVIDLHIELLAGITTYLLDRLEPVIEPAKALFESVATVVGRVKDRVVLLAQRLYEGVKTWMLDRFTAVIDGIKGKVEAVTGFFEDMYTAVVGNSFVPDMIAGISREFATLGTVMVQPAVLATTAVSSAFESAATLVGTHVQGLVNAARGGMDGILAYGSDFAMNFVASTLDTIVPGLGQIVEIAWPIIEEGLKVIANGIQKFFNWVWDGIKAIGRGFESLIFSGVHSDTETADDPSTHENQTEYTRDDIPDMAAGGIVPARRGGTLVNVGEAGMAEAIVPLNRMGGMGGVTVVLNNDLRGAVLDHAAMDRLADQMARRIPRVLQAHRVTG